MKKRKRKYDFTWDVSNHDSLPLPKGHTFYSFYQPKKSDRCYVLTDKAVIELIGRKHET